jgi:A/G-specific adenine glycosylase
MVRSSATNKKKKILSGEIHENLQVWWVKNKRVFPWRNTKNPYKILIAEVLLHRTQAKQVIPVYELMLQKFPNIEVLADSQESELSEVLYPLGLRWRNPMIHNMANEIIANYGGTIPEEFDKLTSLPGVSHYIASAVRCFAFGYPDILLDTNTVRVTGRLFGLKITDASRRSQEFRNILCQLMDNDRPREFNWGLIDLAALVCNPKMPLHEECPLKRYCAYARIERNG